MVTCTGCTGSFCGRLLFSHIKNIVDMTLPAGASGGMRGSEICAPVLLQQLRNLLLVKLLLEDGGPR